jgi:ABC-2 type transport system permease protein
MALSQPRYALEDETRQGRRDRLWAIFAINFRLRASRTFVIVFVVIGFIATLVPLLVTVLTNQITAEFTRGSTSPALSSFFAPYSNFLLFLFIMLLSALAGGGIIADDLGSKSISLYLSRPITLADYLAAKGAVVAAILGLIAVVPGVITVAVAYILGYVSGTVAIEALGVYIGLGILLTVTFASIALFLSSLSERSTWAAAGIFAFLLIDDIVAGILRGVSQNVNWLYVSPWEDMVSVARYLFGVSNNSSSINPAAALAILIGLIICLVAATYTRLSKMELVTE